MSNNTILNPGVGGDTINTEDLGSSKIQRVKIALGGAGSDGGNISSSNPLPSVTGPVINGVMINPDSATSQNWNWTNGKLTAIQYTINSHIYQKAFAYDGSGNISSITWSQLS